MGIQNNNCPDLTQTILQPGYTVITCRPGNETVAIKDMTGVGGEWDAGKRNTNYITNPTIDSWANAEFQGDGIMAIAIDQRTGDIYGGNTRIWGNATPVARIHKIDGITGNVTVFATIPGGLGIGYLDIDYTHNQIFATNYDDGKIYNIDMDTGNTLETFDYLNAGALNNAATPREEMVVGVTYHHQDSKVFYSVYGAANSSTIRSIELDALGRFMPATDKEEIFIGHSFPVGDMEISQSGERMLTSEIQISNNGISTGSHATYNDEMVRCPLGNWAMDDSYSATANGSKYATGNYSGGPNARGGIAWAFHHISNDSLIGFEEWAVMTGDALNYPTPAIYGFQFTPTTGGGPGQSTFIDINGNVGTVDKNQYGEIDVFHGCFFAGTPVPILESLCPNEAPVFTHAVDTFYKDNTSSMVINIDVLDEVGDESTNLITLDLSGADSSLFTINQTTGVINFVSTPVLYNNPQDANTDNIYDLTLIACDTAGLCRTKAIQIEVSIDSDLDGVYDVVDIDDDNDGVLDIVECDLSGLNLAINGSLTGPSIGTTCGFQNQIPDGWANSIITPETFSLPLNACMGAWEKSKDGGSWMVAGGFGAGGEAFAQTIDGLIIGEEYEVRFEQTVGGGTRGQDNPVEGGYWTVTFGSEVKNSSLLATAATAVGWFDEVLTFTATATSQQLQFQGRIDPGAASGVSYMGIDDIRVTHKVAVPCDVDGDGISNQFDLDSDGDGCYDLAESGTGAVGDSLVTQNSSYTSVGLNGLANHLETNDDGTINYTSTYYIAQSNVLNACADSDNDGVGDLIDDYLHHANRHPINRRGIYQRKCNSRL